MFFVLLKERPPITFLSLMGIGFHSTQVGWQPGYCLRCFERNMMGVSTVTGKKTYLLLVFRMALAWQLLKCKDTSYSILFLCTFTG